MSCNYLSIHVMQLPKHGHGRVWTVNLLHVVQLPKHGHGGVWSAKLLHVMQLPKHSHGRVCSVKIFHVMQLPKHGHGRVWTVNILHIIQLPKDNTIQVTFFILNVECFLSKDNENARNCVEHHSLMENSVIPSTWERQTIQISAPILKMTITYLLHLSHLGNQSNLLTRWCHQDSVGNFQILHYLSLKKVRILHYILL